MISNKIKIAFTMAIAVAASQPMLALATNGMNPDGTGPKNRGMGGAGVAMTDETQAIVGNPAAVTRVGSRQDAALGLFSPNDRGFTLSGNGFGFDQSQTSKKNVFAIPFYGYSKQLDSGAAWAFTLSAVGGMNTDYPINFGAVPFGFTGNTGIDLAQLFVGGTYGAEFSDSLAWGVTVSLAYAQFAAEGLEAFAGASSDPTKLTNNGTDTATGIGLKVGLIGDFAGGGSWGTSYQFKTDMSEFKKYAGLFPDQGDLDIAPTFSLGVAFPLSDDTTLAVDYHYIDYEAVDAISNPTSLVLTGGQFGDSGGPGFGWKSINVIKVGVEMQTAPNMIWRTGFNIGESPLDGDEFSTAFLVPATVTKHLMVGFTRELDSSSELTFVYVRSLNESQTGSFSPAFGGGTLTAEMEQNFIELSYGSRF